MNSDWFPPCSQWLSSAPEEKVRWGQLSWSHCGQAVADGRGAAERPAGVEPAAGGGQLPQGHSAWCQDCSRAPATPVCLQTRRPLARRCPQGEGVGRSTHCSKNQGQGASPASSKATSRPVTWKGGSCHFAGAVNSLLCLQSLVDLPSERPAGHCLSGLSVDPPSGAY